MGGGGKGGGSQTTTTKVELDPEIKAEALKNMRIADQVAQVGYQPYQGPTVAAFAPAQQQSFENNQNAAAAFGMGNFSAANRQQGGADPYTGMPAPTEYAGGLLGYSPYELYEQQRQNIPDAVRRKINSFVMNPRTGAAPSNPAFRGGGGGWGGGGGGGGPGGPPGGQGGMWVADPNGNQQTWQRRNPAATNSGTVWNDNAGNVGGGYF